MSSATGPGALPRVLHGAGLPYHRDPDLPRVGEVRLDLLRDVPRKESRRVVPDLLVVDDDADLPARLDRVRLLDPGERFRDRFEVLETLEVVRQHLPAGAGPGAGGGSRRLHQDRQGVPGGLTLVGG